MNPDNQPVLIDGSVGEGGGQVLRTSLALACITGRPFHIENIRAARPNPGLAKQHLSCVRAATRISRAECTGDEIGSQILSFRPGPVQGGDYRFEVGSAGSATLVAQTVLPALFLADKPSSVTVTGGTHNPWAPPFDFLNESFLPAIWRSGFRARCRLLKHGFYPAGGGIIALAVTPAGRPRPIDLCARPTGAEIRARIYTAKLPSHIAARQQGLLGRAELEFAEIEQVEVGDSDGPGNCVMIRICTAVETTVFTAFGQRGKPSKEVVSEVIETAVDFLGSGAAIDRYLADQLLIYIALSRAGSFTTNQLSSHLLTNIQVIKKFLPVDFDVQEQGRIYRVSCRPASNSPPENPA